VFYKSPSLLNLFFVEHASLSIPSFSMILIMFNMIGFYLDRKSTDQEKNAKKISERLKDAKRMLLS
jgi:preprotein translocase subunit YajC